MYCIADIFCQIFINSKTAKFDQWKGQNKVQLCVSINKPGFSSKMAKYFRTTWQPYTQGPCFMLHFILGKICVIQICAKVYLTFMDTFTLHHTVLKSCFYKIYVIEIRVIGTCVMQGLGVGPRYSTRDHLIQESINEIFNSGLFWAVRAAEKKNPNCHK